MLENTFWLLFIAIIYCYFLYPFSIWIVAQFYKKNTKNYEYKPNVSILISLWNEEDVIEQRIKNLLELEYPNEKIEILIGSDGSTDNSVNLIEEFKIQNLYLFNFQKRRGKPSVLNDLMCNAKGEIIFFCDARQKLDKYALKELISNFTNPRIGCVSGELILEENQKGVGGGVGFYWKYEKFIRAQESKVHSILGATGAIYAIRANLFTKLPHDVILDDMYTPLKIINNGYRSIFDETAKAYDKVAVQGHEEKKRKVRTLAGNYQIIQLFSGLFIPLKSPIAIQLLSHKFLRLLIPFLMIAIFFVNIFLCDIYFYKILMLLQICFYLFGAIGYLATFKSNNIINPLLRICGLIYTFLLLNFSAMLGLLKYFHSNQEITWDKARDI